VIALDCGVPANPVIRALWRVYTTIGLPIVGRAISERRSRVGAFLRGSIERFNAAHPQHTLERHWREAGLVDVQVAQMSFGAGVVMTGVKDGATEEASLHRAGTTETLSTRRGPPGQRIPSSVLLALGSLALLGAVLLGVIAAATFGPWFLALVVVGAALVILYGLEIPIVHSDIGFALAWGGFPVLASAAANGAAPLPTIVAAVGATLLSLAQRRLSTPVRRIRRKALEVSGTVRFRDGTTEGLDRGALIAGPEAGLRPLWLAMVPPSIGAL